MQNIDQERLLRFNDLQNNGVDARDRFISSMKAAFSKDDCDEIMRVLSFSETLNYQHKGLTKEAYLSHPYRVAVLTVNLIEPVDISATVLALIHNVLEVASISEVEFLKIFECHQLHELKTLTIDRSKKSPEYLADYYQSIYEARKQVRMVKALDKLDNLYMLCLNSDASVRADYLLEISNYILPIVQKDLPHLTGCYEKLILNCQDIGHISL